MSIQALASEVPLKLSTKHCSLAFQDGRNPVSLDSRTPICIQSLANKLRTVIQKDPARNFSLKTCPRITSESHFLVQAQIGNQSFLKNAKLYRVGRVIALVVKPLLERLII